MQETVAEMLRKQTVPHLNSEAVSALFLTFLEQFIHMMQISSKCEAILYVTHSAVIKLLKEQKQNLDSPSLSCAGTQEAWYRHTAASGTFLSSNPR